MNHRFLLCGLLAVGGCAVDAGEGQLVREERLGGKADTIDQYVEVREQTTGSRVVLDAGEWTSRVTATLDEDSTYGPQSVEIAGDELVVRTGSTRWHRSFSVRDSGNENTADWAIHVSYRVRDDDEWTTISSGFGDLGLFETLEIQAWRTANGSGLRLGPSATLPDGSTMDNTDWSTIVTSEDWSTMWDLRVFAVPYDDFWDIQGEYECVLSVQ